MSGMIIGLLAETSVHPGVGQSDSAVDLPVAREKPTDYPFVPGSGVKGALRQKAMETFGETDENASPKTDALFGVQDNAGVLLVSDARLLLLPVRSLTGSYKWLTCPHIVERYARDRVRQDFDEFDVDLSCLSSGTAMATGTGELFLEERNFTICEGQDDALNNLATFLCDAIADTSAKARLASQLAVVHDDVFSWFARYALPVDAHNVLDRKTKSSDNLWYEETLPSDTIMSVVVEERNGLNSGVAPLRQAKKLFEDNSYLRLGGNETTGQGWFRCCISHTEGD